MCTDCANPYTRTASESNRSQSWSGNTNPSRPCCTYGETICITDGSAGLKGRLLATGELQELKVLASAAMSGFARGTQDRTQTALGTTITGSVSNGVREGVGDVFDLYAKRTLKDIEDNGYFVRVAAGKEFYVYVLQSVDPQKASVAGIKLRPATAPDAVATQPPIQNPTKG